MYTLAETWKMMYGKKPTEDWDGLFMCVEMDVERAYLTNTTQGMMSCYTFNLITKGWITILYNGQELTLLPNTLYTYTPGQAITVLSASQDMHGYCLLAEESLTLETSTFRNIIRAVYLPITTLNEPAVLLSHDDASHLKELMLLIIDYFHSTHLYKQESLRLLYSLFLLDTLHAQEKAVACHRQLPKRTEEIFLSFMRLLSQHFTEHHDIPFYASSLNITPTYLSRIVREITGRTVIDYINQLLIMEAIFLLRTSSLNIAQITERLHFADPATFSKFFSRMKGISPKKYRER